MIPTRLEIRRAYEKRRAETNLPVVWGEVEEAALDVAMANLNREHELRLAVVLLATWRRANTPLNPVDSPKDAA